MGEPKDIRTPPRPCPLADRTQLGSLHTRRPAGEEAWGPLGDLGTAARLQDVPGTAQGS